MSEDSHRSVLYGRLHEQCVGKGAHLHKGKVQLTLAHLSSPMGDTYCMGTTRRHKALLHPCILGHPFASAGIADEFPPG